MKSNEFFTKIAEDKYLVKQLTNAVISSYCRETTIQEKNLVFDTLDAISGKQNYRNYSCRNCVFRAFSTVGKEFLKWQQKQNEVIATPENGTETVEAKEVKKDVKSTASKTKKKSTTKSKSTTKKSSKSEK